MIFYVIEFVGGKPTWMTFRAERVYLILKRGKKKNVDNGWTGLCF